MEIYDVHLLIVANQIHKQFAIYATLLIEIFGAFEGQ